MCLIPCLPLPQARLPHLLPLPGDQGRWSLLFSGTHLPPSLSTGHGPAAQKTEPNLARAMPWSPPTPTPREPTPAGLLSEDDLPSPGRARANPLLLCLNLFVSAPVHPLIRASTCQALITCAGYRGHRGNNIHEVPLPTLARQRGQEAHT